MKIQPNPPTSGIPVYEPQASFLAACIRRLERATKRELGERFDPWGANSRRFWELPEYEVFHDAAYACGFVCNDLEPSFQIDAAAERPQQELGQISFEKLRHYVHTLLRAERANRMNGEFSPILQALLGGALATVAQRLESDESLIDS